MEPVELTSHPAPRQQLLWDLAYQAPNADLASLDMFVLTADEQQEMRALLEKVERGLPALRAS